jgi:hypothetical protein
VLAENSDPTNETIANSVVLGSFVENESCVLDVKVVVLLKSQKNPMN